MRETIAPKNRLDRQQRHEAFWQGRKKQFFLAIGLLSVALQLLFLGNMAYVYGSLWKSTSRYHNFNVLYIDYDEGIVGQSVSAAYQQLRGANFPTLVPQDKALYPSMEHVVEAVKETKYWAAFVINVDASNRLVQALQGGQLAQSYNASNALTYVWNEVRYPALSDEILMANFEKLETATRFAYNMLNGKAALGLVNKNDPAAVQVLLNPIAASGINIMPTTQQTKLFYNSVSMVTPILQQFFFLLILNGISQKLQIYSKLPVHISGLVRVALSVVFDFIAGLCWTGYVWGFRETWDVSERQFVLTWMVMWLLMHVHFLVIDVCTVVLPLPGLPFFLLTWIIVNITSSISPFEANPGFYKWGYALPTNEAYIILTDIWSRGSVPQLNRSLPILVSWWVVGLSLATWAHLYRCHKAWEEDAKIEESEAAIRKELRGTSLGASGVGGLRTTPSETLLAAADVYRSVYGPSVTVPAGLWARFEPRVDDPDHQPTADTLNRDGSK